jgi:polyisoprenoid-binding protein YceI
MRRRVRILVLVAVVAVILVVVGGYAVLALTGDDAPPPPKLSGRPATGGTAGQGGEGWRVVRAAGTFVGYRVDEEYLGVGVRTAVGRTNSVDGRLTVDGTRLTTARVSADLRRLRSDQSRRDDALRYRGIETDRYPAARFTLTAPVALTERGRRAAGTLALHGRDAPITATVRGQRLAGERLEVVGSAPIDFARFAIEPPSVAGVVTVRDHGVLEFRLVFEPEGG